MRTTLCIIALLSVCACTTTTETRPDGTVVTTKGFDLGAFKIVADTTTAVLPVLVEGK